MSTRASLSVCRETGRRLFAAAADLDQPVASIVEQLVEDVLSWPPDEQAAFVERVRSRSQVVHPTDERLTLTLPAWLNDPTQPRPTGRDYLAAKGVEVDDGIWSMLSDLVVRERELYGREVTREQLFEVALLAAVFAAEAGAR